MPGFTAEASIYPSSVRYRAYARHTPSEAVTIVSAMNGWPPFVTEPGASWEPMFFLGCGGPHAVVYAAKWSGRNYAACVSNPHPEVGHPPGGGCDVGSEGDMWGIWYLPDWDDKC